MRSRIDRIFYSEVNITYNLFQSIFRFTARPFTVKDFRFCKLCFTVNQICIFMASDNAIRIFINHFIRVLNPFFGIRFKDTFISVIVIFRISFITVQNLFDYKPTMFPFDVIIFVSICRFGTPCVVPYFRNLCRTRIWIDRVNSTDIRFIRSGIKVFSVSQKNSCINVIYT